MLGCHVVVTGTAGAGKSTLASALAANLGMVLLSKDRLKERCIALLRQRPHPSRCN
jgi:adenylate kinase family enzyme